jgi:hypothetical protein
MNRNISAILILVSFLAGFGVARLTQPARMRHRFYGEIIFCGNAGDTNSDLASRLQNRLESGGFKRIPTGEPGPNADPIRLVLDGIVPITVWHTNFQSYFDGDGDVARLTFGRVNGEELNYFELEMLPGGPKGGFDDKLEGVPLALKLREDILKELSNQRMHRTPR